MDRRRRRRRGRRPRARGVRARGLAAGPRSRVALPEGRQRRRRRARYVPSGRGAARPAPRRGQAARGDADHRRDDRSGRRPARRLARRVRGTHRPQLRPRPARTSRVHARRLHRRTRPRRGEPVHSDLRQPCGQDRQDRARRGQERARRGTRRAQTDRQGHHHECPRAEAPPGAIAARRPRLGAQDLAGALHAPRPRRRPRPRADLDHRRPLGDLPRWPARRRRRHARPCTRRHRNRTAVASGGYPRRGRQGMAPVPGRPSDHAAVQAGPPGGIPAHRRRGADPQLHQPLRRAHPAPASARRARPRPRLALHVAGWLGESRPGRRPGTPAARPGRRVLGRTAVGPPRSRRRPLVQPRPLRTGCASRATGTRSR